MSYTETFSASPENVHVTQCSGPNGRKDVELVIGVGLARMSADQAIRVSACLLRAALRQMAYMTDPLSG